MGAAKVIPPDTILLPYQAKWVKDRSRLKIAEKSRQIGWTWATAYGLVRRQAQVDARLDSWISSRDEIQARLFLEDCKSFANILKIGAEDLGDRVIDEKGNSAFVLQMANGTRLHSMSSNPDAQAGKRGSRVLDEFALHNDPRKLYSIAYPGITWGGQLEIFSTHRGTYNFFNELVEEVKHKGNPKGFSLHRVTLQDALEQGFLFKLQEKLPADDPRQEMDEAAYFDFIRAGAPDEETFLQEYMCVPANDAAAFLPYDMIAACEYPATEVWEMDFDVSQGPLFLGVDIGRDHDLTVIWAVEKIGGMFFTRVVREMQGAAFSEQEAVLYDMLDNPRVRRCAIDRTGIGRQFAERATERYGQYRIEEVNFSGPVKEQLAYPVRAAFEDKTIRIPNAPKVRADLRSIQKSTTEHGNIRFTADRGKNGHADRFWALALALHAGKDAPVVFAPQRFKESKFSRAREARRNREVLA